MDEHGRPLYGDVFGVQQTDANIIDDEQVDSNLWGELESESEESEESEVSFILALGHMIPLLFCEYRGKFKIQCFSLSFRRNQRRRHLINPDLSLQPKREFLRYIS